MASHLGGLSGAPVVRVENLVRSFGPRTILDGLSL